MHERNLRLFDKQHITTEASVSIKLSPEKKLQFYNLLGRLKLRDMQRMYIHRERNDMEFQMLLSSQLHTNLRKKSMKQMIIATKHL